VGGSEITLNTPYSAVLIMAVLEVQVVPDVERFMPDAKLGNVKDPSKIEQKKREHEARWRESLPGDPLLSVPTKIEWRAITQAGEEGGVGAVKTFMEACDKVFASYSPQVVLGPHPTTHMRLVQNAVLRSRQSSLQEAFTRRVSPGVVTRINIWKDVCPDNRGDCSDIRQVLDFCDAQLTDVDATLELAKILGYIE